MNTTIQSDLQSNHAQMQFQDGQLSVHLNFIMQSAEYLGLKISRDDAASVFQQTHRH